MSLNTTTSQPDEGNTLLYKLVKSSKWKEGSPCIKKVWGRKHPTFGEKDYYIIDGWTVLVGRTTAQPSYIFFEYEVAMKKLKLVLLQELDDLRRKIQNATLQLETVQRYIAVIEEDQVDKSA